MGRRMAGDKVRRRGGENRDNRMQGGPGMGLSTGMGNEQMSGSGPRAMPYIDQRGQNRDNRMQGGPGMGLATGYGNEQMPGSGPRKAPDTEGFKNMLIETLGSRQTTEGMRR